MDNNSARKPMQISFKRKVLYTLLPTALLCLLLEIGLRIVYFNMRASTPLAIQLVIPYAQNFVYRKYAEFLVADVAIPKGAFEKLWQEEGKEVLPLFQKRYREHFERLVMTAKANGSKLIVMYVPMNDSMERVQAMNANKKFISALCYEFGVEYLDTTEELHQYPVETFTLMPENGHLSRFGNIVVANILGKFIESKYGDYRTSNELTERPEALGDLRPQNEIWLDAPNMPYRVIVNAQGFRMEKDLVFPKQKQRILVLGDSFTFGPFLDNHDTYPELLNKKFSEKEFINAGVSGYTITDEASMFVEKAQYANPDIIVLQVLDNDFFDLFYFQRNLFDRKGRAHEPTPIEEEFLRKVRSAE